MDDGWMMDGWWMDDGWMMGGWWMDDGWMMDGWWMGDGWMMNGWWMDDGCPYIFHPSIIRTSSSSSIHHPSIHRPSKQALCVRRHIQSDSPIDAGNVETVSRFRRRHERRPNFGTTCVIRFTKFFWRGVFWGTIIWRAFLHVVSHSFFAKNKIVF